MAGRQLKRWEAAGLIDAATAARIRKWEADHSRPLGLWAVIGIAALAIGLGLISVVAANWDAIPGVVRLAIHFALLAGGAGLLWAKGPDLAARHPWFHEAALFVFAMLGMTFLGHVGQVYQTTSPLWQPLALWLLLFSPLLLAQGLSWLSAAMVMGIAVITVWNHAENGGGFDAKGNLSTMRWALETGAPVLVTGLAGWLRGHSARTAFWRRMEQIALAYGVAGASLIAIASAFQHLPDLHDAQQAFTALASFAALTLVSGGWVWLSSVDASDRATAAILGGCGLVALVAFPLSGTDIAGGLLFMALWAGIAAAALYSGWRGAFQFAVGVVALRLIVLSFELGGDLLTSGAGLIASGLLILAIAWAALRVSRRFAPMAEERR